MIEQKEENNTEIINAINLLIREGYFVNIEGVLGHTGKLARFYSNLTNSTKQQPQQSAINSIKSVENKITLTEFRDKAKIPFRITANKGTAKELTYNVGQIALPAEKYFNSKVVGKVDMNLLIEVTKAFYADEKQARPTLTNYFLNGVWEGMLKEYKPKTTIEVANKSYTGDRKL